MRLDYEHTHTYEKRVTGIQSIEKCNVWESSAEIAMHKRIIFFMHMRWSNQHPIIQHPISS